MTETLNQSFESVRSYVSTHALPELGEDKLEPVYEELLRFLEAHATERPTLAHLLAEEVKANRSRGVSNQSRIPIQAIAYCMHLLRWSEVLEAAKRENDEFYSHRMSTALEPIIGAYFDDWEDRDFYRRFSLN
jgi:hypothetical protein